MTHEGGHLPFEAVVSKNLKFGKENWITVAVNNTLTPTTLPPGSITYKGDPNRLDISLHYRIAFTRWANIYFDESYSIHQHKLISGSSGKHLLPLDSNHRPQWLWVHLIPSEESITLPLEPLRPVQNNMLSCSTYVCQASTLTPLYWSNSLQI